MPTNNEKEFHSIALRRPLREYTLKIKIQFKVERLNGKAKCITFNFKRCSDGINLKRW